MNFIRILYETYSISKTDYHIKKIDWIFLINELNEINEIHSLTNIAAFTIYMYVQIHAVNQTSPEFYK